MSACFVDLNRDPGAMAAWSPRRVVSLPSPLTDPEALHGSADCRDVAQVVQALHHRDDVKDPVLDDLGELGGPLLDHEGLEQLHHLVRGAPELLLPVRARVRKPEPWRRSVSVRGGYASQGRGEQQWRATAPLAFGLQTHFTLVSPLHWNSSSGRARARKLGVAETTLRRLDATDLGSSARLDSGGSAVPGPRTPPKGNLLPRFRIRDPPLAADRARSMSNRHGSHRRLPSRLLGLSSWFSFLAKGAAEGEEEKYWSPLVENGRMGSKSLWPRSPTCFLPWTIQAQQAAFILPPDRHLAHPPPLLQGTISRKKKGAISARQGRGGVRL